MWLNKHRVERFFLKNTILVSRRLIILQKFKIKFWLCKTDEYMCVMWQIKTPLRGVGWQYPSTYDIPRVPRLNMAPCCETDDSPDLHNVLNNTIYIYMICLLMSKVTHAKRIWFFTCQKITRNHIEIITPKFQEMHCRRLFKHALRNCIIDFNGHS